MALIETLIPGALICGCVALGAGSIMAGDWIREHYIDGVKRRTRLNPMQYYMVDRDADLMRIRREAAKRERQLGAPKPHNDNNNGHQH